MAGLAAGRANNGKCGVGVAYDSYITGMYTHFQFQKTIGGSLELQGLWFDQLKICWFSDFQSHMVLCCT